MKDEFFTIKFDGVAGIGTSLKTCNDIIARSQHIHDFAFSLIAPLEPKQNVNFHCLKCSKFLI